MKPFRSPKEGFVKEILIDIVGQYYAALAGRDRPVMFALAVHLNEAVCPDALQGAVDGALRRLPFLNGRLKNGFFHYKLELLDSLPKITREEDEPLFDIYYGRGERRMVSVTYGERSFTVKATHCVCDGRGLSMLARAVICRYFGLPGWDGARADDEEWENAFDRYMSGPPPAKKTPPAEAAYIADSAPPSLARYAAECFDAGKTKARAKANGLTVGGFLLAHIMLEAAGERNRAGKAGRIACMVPIDCRGFFPTRTLRSFVSAETIFMPETAAFGEVARSLAEQFAGITRDSVRRQLHGYRRLYNAAAIVPRALKKLYMRGMDRSEEITTGLSNLGPISLPPEAEERVSRIEFPIAPEFGCPYFFSCATVGNALALSCSYSPASEALVAGVMGRLREAL